MDAAEAEFIAEKEIITIIPNFKGSKLFLLSCDIGPFKPGIPTNVPVWVAMNLKQRQKCRLSPPDWLSVERLSEFKDEESVSDVFIKPPCSCYMELASMLLGSCSDDIPQADTVKTLIKDVWDIRTAKLRKSIDQMISKQERHAQIDNLTIMEINTIRSILTNALDHMHNLRCYVAQLPDT
ncbi:DNA replication complex GINS protein PSF2-like [Rhopilema esculentum]|uniref:DNA replication complex GINS protein PSF2-like n=1 Tax=Rhopilema esculentum TaxID=499914 RepID=UPI0031CE3F47|eukprot:gene1694-16171_t